MNGHQITADKQEQSLTRDAQKWKRIDSRLRPDYRQEELETRTSETDLSDEDEVLNIQSTGQETTAEEVESQDTTPAGI